MKRMSFRFPRWIFPAGFVALCANGALLGTALFLTHTRPLQRQDITSPGGVTTFDMAPEEAPAAQTVQEPTKPPEQPRPDLGSDLANDIDLNAELQALGNIGGAGVSINLGGATTAMAKKDLVFEQYELDQAPRPVVKIPPVYPGKARSDGVEGVVQVKFLVRDDGTVGDVQIVDSRPKDVFDDAVINAIQKWRFDPGVIGGKRVSSWVITALHFKLN
jgi:TonB family protein